MEKSINDELIMAYVDGELRGDEKARVEDALNKDEKLKEKARMFRESATMLQGAFDEILSEDIPEHLLGVVKGERQGDSSSKHTLWDRLKLTLNQIFQAPNVHPGLVAVTACLLIIGFAAVIYRITNHYVEPVKAPALSNLAEFQRGISKTPSGESFLIQEKGIEISPILTFKDKQYSYCREFEMASASRNESVARPSASGIACLTGKGKWKIIAFHPVEERGKHELQKEGYKLAGGENPVDSLVEKRRVGAPLSAAEELEKIKNGWK